MFDLLAPISTVEDVIGIKPAQFWLNVQYDTFYTQNKHSPATFVQKALRFMAINYISSPEFTAEDLATIKSYASGILVPKEYILPVKADKNTCILLIILSSLLTGALTDFPPTASEAIGCFANNKQVKPAKGNPLIITKNGASGIYPGATDLAYQQAVDDGTDIIDCSVQMSKDGVAFCLDSADLMGSTNVITQITTVFKDFPRNPAYKNSGKFVTLAEFLEFAKAKGASGILINIQNAAYLASKKGLDIVGSVTTALSNATFDKQSTQSVLIQSDDTSVLSKFKSVPTYQSWFSVKLGSPEVQPPAAAPLPPLDSADVVDPPLPPVANISTASSPVAEAPSPSASISFANVAKMDLSLMAIMVLSLLSMLN
ncbi:glycerophosphodiester phosphodiesterase gdpdl6 [Quercus suber]|uniref:glycerophosphodiester phosphodiesterase n=1 Tax=Quercus suber TaxID=58331 RepID=A0AAW0LF09_QUESU